MKLMKNVVLGTSLMLASAVAFAGPIRIVDRMPVVIQNTKGYFGNEYNSPVVQGNQVDCDKGGQTVPEPTTIGLIGLGLAGLGLVGRRKR